MMDLSNKFNITPLFLDKIDTWGTVLCTLTACDEWTAALKKVGKVNANPARPLQAILLTMRVSDQAIKDVDRLLSQIEYDSLCRYMVVVAIDGDNNGDDLVTSIKSRGRVESCIVLSNPPLNSSEPFMICNVWDRMAKAAWEDGADWVVLLGDDIEVLTPYHYRETYRTFLDIRQNMKLKQECPYFGCPYWNDFKFPGFPSFPVVGRQHYEIFGALIPSDRAGNFINQDLDPYLQRLYLKFGAAPPMNTSLKNTCGGDETGAARYNRVPANGWRDFVLEDVQPIKSFLLSNQVSPCNDIFLLDVVVPSYRLSFDHLSEICSMNVPSGLRTTFIIIVDNPELLVNNEASLLEDDLTPNEAARRLELHLVEAANEAGHHKNIRVRCNAENGGASFSRNRGLNDYLFVLFLDDDIIPSKDLLLCYDREVRNLQEDEVGLVGLFRFPRPRDISMKQAAVLMSYLTFMFEIAMNDMYKHPAWGVTANILFRRTKVRFDTRYAKTGGGEDVDYCLRVIEETGMKLKTAPSATVYHDFWPGDVPTLSMHFFNWAVGDSALFTRYPELVYSSWPNAVETYILVLSLQIVTGTSMFNVLITPLFILLADVAVEVSNGPEYRHRCLLLDHEHTPLFLLASHVLANLYVIVLETGRLYGHWKRGAFGSLSRRFDWHCGRLPKAPANFRRRELIKFVLFVIIGWISLTWSKS